MRCAPFGLEVGVGCVGGEVGDVGAVICGGFGFGGDGDCGGGGGSPVPLLEGRPAIRERNPRCSAWTWMSEVTAP